MLCSAKELNLSHGHEGLFLIPASVANGTPMETLIPETDTLIEFDNKSVTNRPDLWGHYGFAREFAALFNRELKPLPQLDLSQFENLPKIPIQIVGAIHGKVLVYKGKERLTTPLEVDDALSHLAQLIHSEQKHS